MDCRVILLHAAEGENPTKAANAKPAETTFIDYYLKHTKKTTWILLQGIFKLIKNHEERKTHVLVPVTFTCVRTFLKVRLSWVHGIPIGLGPTVFIKHKENMIISN